MVLQKVKRTESELTSLRSRRRRGPEFSFVFWFYYFFEFSFISLVKSLFDFSIFVFGWIGLKGEYQYLVREQAKAWGPTDRPTDVGLVGGGLGLCLNYVPRRPG